MSIDGLWDTLRRQSKQTYSKMLRYELNLIKQIFFGSPALWSLFFILWMISFTVVPSALAKELFNSSAELTLSPVFKHFGFLLGSIIITVAISQAPTNIWRSWGTSLIIVISIILTIWLLVAPHEVNGSERWVQLFGLSTQPSEMTKVAIVLSACMLSSYTRRSRGTKERRNIFWLFWLLSILISLVYAFENLSTSILLILNIVGCSLFITPPWRSFFRIFASLGIIAIVAVGGLVLFDREFLQQTHLARAVTWQNRIHDALGKKDRQDKTGYEQKDYAMMAISRGGQNFGIKLGDDSKLSKHLPMAPSDFVYSIIVEKWGIFGAIGIPALYLWWAILCYRLSIRTRSVLKRSLALCIGFIVPLQALVNLVIGSGIFVTGQTLPLISSGGTSMLTSSLLMGILLSISRESMIEEEAEDLEEETEIQTYAQLNNPNEREND